MLTLPKYIARLPKTKVTNVTEKIIRIALRMD